MAPGPARVAALRVRVGGPWGPGRAQACIYRIYLVNPRWVRGYFTVDFWMGEGVILRLKFSGRRPEDVRILPPIDQN